jgi:Txe/YoeB family toxin of Txe-Axe toxin-antitoxin module
MKIKELNVKLAAYVKAHRLEKKYEKAKALFENDFNHPSLNVEILEPKHLRIYSFRIDLKYRAIFIIVEDKVEVITITNHYH